MLGTKSCFFSRQNAASKEENRHANVEEALRENSQRNQPAGKRKWPNVRWVIVSQVIKAGIGIGVKYGEGRN